MRSKWGKLKTTNGVAPGGCWVKAKKAVVLSSGLSANTLIYAIKY
jgi:hypothetical protein